MAIWFCSVFNVVCRKRLSSPRCKSELIDSAWVVIVPGQKMHKKRRGWKFVKMDDFMFLSTIFAFLSLFCYHYEAVNDMYTLLTIHYSLVEICFNLTYSNIKNSTFEIWEYLVISKFLFLTHLNLYITQMLHLLHLKLLYWCSFGNFRFYFNILSDYYPIGVCYIGIVGG